MKKHHHKSPIIIITGPTASGKSDLAVDLAEAFGGMVINADSMQVYKILHLLTARPEKKALEKSPHRLFGILDPEDYCSAGRWLNMAHEAINEARDRGFLPVLVGGTGLYLKALMQGLVKLPSIPHAVKQHAREFQRISGTKALYQKLAEIDSRSAQRIAPHDKQRLLRAFEVMLATGRSLFDWQQDTTSTMKVPGVCIPVALVPSRQKLYPAIEQRFDESLLRGALEEVRTLIRRGVSAHAPVMKAHGVPELSMYLQGKTTLMEACQQAKLSIRRYTKRQTTWINHQFSSIYRYQERYEGSQRAIFCEHIKEKLLTLTR